MINPPDNDAGYGGFAGDVLPWSGEFGLVDSMSFGEWGQVQGGTGLPVGLTVSHCEVDTVEGGIWTTFTWEAEDPLPVATTSQPVVTLGQLSLVDWQVTNYGASATDVNMTVESWVNGIDGFSTVISDFPTLDGRRIIGNINVADQIYLAGARVPVTIFSPDILDNFSMDTLEVHLPSYGVQWPDWDLTSQYPVLNVYGNLVVVGDNQQIECYAGNLLRWTAILDGSPIAIAISADTQWVAAATTQSIYLFSATEGLGNTEHWWQQPTALPYVAFSDNCLWTVSGNNLLCCRLDNPSGLLEAIPCPFAPTGFALGEAGSSLYFGLVAGNMVNGTNGKICLMDSQGDLVYPNTGSVPLNPQRAYANPVLGDVNGDGSLDMYAQYQNSTGHAGLASITYSVLFEAYGIGWGDFTSNTMTSRSMPYSIGFTRRHDDADWQGARIVCGHTSRSSLGVILQNNVLYGGVSIRLGSYVQKEAFVSGFDFTANDNNVLNITEKSSNELQAYDLSGTGWTDIAGPTLFDFSPDSVIGPLFCWYDPATTSWLPAAPVKRSNSWSLKVIGLNTSLGSDWNGYHGNAQNTRGHTYRGNGFWTNECLREGEVTITFAPAQRQPTLASYVPMFINCCFPDSHIIGVEIQRWGAVDWIPDTTIWGESFDRAQYLYLLNPTHASAQYRGLANFGSGSPMNINDGSNFWGQH